jgi:hypothetical protein
LLQGLLVHELEAALDPQDTTLAAEGLLVGVRISQQTRGSKPLALYNFVRPIEKKIVIDSPSIGRNKASVLGCFAGKGGTLESLPPLKRKNQGIKRLVNTDPVE